MRYVWVDIAKGIAILAVVLLHIDFTFPETELFPLRAFLGASWHVEVFFLIAGFFIQEEKLCRPLVFIKSKVKTLYRPLLCFYIPAVLFHNVMMRLGWYDPTIAYGGKYMYYWDFGQLVTHLSLSVCLAGREPILGAMWFVYVLFMALCGFSFVSWLISKISCDRKKHEWMRFFTLLMLCILSCVASRVYGFTIPRCNNVLTAMWLIYVGYVCRNKLLLRFDNKYVCIASALLFYHGVTVIGWIAVGGNYYSDVISLTWMSVAALYVVCYISKQMEHNPVGCFLSCCGRNSFYIMALHLVGFKIGTYTLACVGVDRPLSALIAPAGNSFLLLFYYFLFGVFFSLAFMVVFRKLRCSHSSLSK